MCFGINNFASKFHTDGPSRTLLELLDKPPKVHSTTSIGRSEETHSPLNHQRRRAIKPDLAAAGDLVLLNRAQTDKHSTAF